jgi:hypothetical protein
MRTVMKIGTGIIFSVLVAGSPLQAQGGIGEDANAVAVQQQAIDNIRFTLREAEAARLAGNCSLFADRLRRAGSLMRMSTRANMPSVVTATEAELIAERDRPCTRRAETPPSASVGQPLTPQASQPPEGPEHILDEIGTEQQRDLLRETPDDRLGPEVHRTEAMRNEIWRFQDLLRGAADHDCELFQRMLGRQAEDLESRAVATPGIDAQIIGGLRALLAEARTQGLGGCRRAPPPPPCDPPLSPPSPMNSGYEEVRRYQEWQRRCEGQIPPRYHNAQEFFGAVFLGESRLPAAGTGVRRDGAAGTAPERFAGETEHSVWGWGIEGGLQVPVGDTQLRIFLGYSEAEGDNRFTCPVGGGVDCGIVYGDNAPSGSSGIIAPFGLDGTTEVDSTTFSGRAEIDLFGGCHEDAPACGASITGYGYADYAHEDRDYHLNAATSGVSGGFTFSFAQDRDQKIREDRIGAGFGLRLDIPLAPRLDFTLDASAGGYYRSSRLNSVERNTSNFGPASDRDFTLDIRDSDHGFGLQFGLQPGIRFWARPGLAFSLSGAFSYSSQTGAIFNPSSGDQVFAGGLSTGLSRDNRSSYGGFVSVLGVF